MTDPVAALLGGGLSRLVRRGLRGIWLAGQAPAGPFVWAANHHSWWDPFVAFTVLRHLGRPACLVVAQDNLARYGFARRLGAFGSGEPRTGLRHLLSGRTLVIYPEGELRPAGPPGPLADGASWFATRTGVPLCSVAVRLVLRGHQAPEAYLTLSTVLTGVRLADTTRRLASTMAADLSRMDGWLATAEPSRPLAGFRPVTTGQRSWDERIDAMVGRAPWRG